MADPLSQVFFPAGFQELFAAWHRFPDAVLFAGGTELIRNQSRHTLRLPQNIISLEHLEELSRISRTERYIEIGAMVKLNQIIQLGKIVPEALTRCIKNIAGPQLRSQATIGGNLCNPSRKLDCSVPMVALDAHYELRTAQSARWIAASRISSLPGGLADLGPQEILTRIRVPLDPWTYTWYRKFRFDGSKEPGGGILFIMRNEKNVLTNIRVVYSGQAVFREKHCETRLEGKLLPLERKDVKAFVDGWKIYLSSAETEGRNLFPDNNMNYSVEFMKTRIVNFIEAALMRISD